jgi:hypothetical protein
MASPGFPREGVHVRRKGDGLTGVVYDARSDKGLLGVRWLEKSECKTLLLDFERFTRDWEVTRKTGKWKPNSRWLRENAAYLGTTMFIFLVIMIGVGIKACSDFTLPSEVIGEKTSVVDGNTQFEVTMKLVELDGLDGSSLSVAVTSSHIAEIVKHELDEHNAAQTVVFHIVEDAGGGYDAYGRPQPTHLIGAFDIGYSMKDLKMINWDTVGLNGRWLLDLGTVSNITGAGDEAIRKYCVDDGQKEYAQVFCANY